MKKSKNTLVAHLDRINELLPESRQIMVAADEPAENNALYLTLMKSLRIIEVLYMQDNQMFRMATVEEYAKIIQEMNQLGYDYTGHAEIMDKAASQLILKAKKPMKLAKGRKAIEEHKKAM